MKSIKLFVLLTGLLTFTCSNVLNSANTKLQKSVHKREYYQLKTYIFKTDEQAQTTDKFLEKAYIPALKKLGIKNIGVFKPKPNEKDTVKRTLILIPISSLDKLLTIEVELSKDNTFKKEGIEYLGSSYKQPPYHRIESVLLQAFDDMPFIKIPKFNNPRFDRVYELRSYESPTEAYSKNKIDMFNAGGEIKLFDKLGFNTVFCGEVISGSKMPNLMYMTTFSDQKSRDEHWNSFREAPEWLAMKILPKYLNNMVRSEITFLYPTDYSDY